MVGLILRMRAFVHRLSLALRMLRTRNGRERLSLVAAARMPKIVDRMARLYRATWVRQTRIIAVIGSFGKTTTTRTVSAALGHSDLRFIGWNCGVALPMALLRIRPWARYAAIEAAIAGKNQMDKYAELLRPDLVVVTTIGSEHHTSLGTLEDTRAEKAKMLEALPVSGQAILNADDPNVLWMRERTQASVITYGLAESALIRASDVDARRIEGLRFRLHVRGESRDVQTRLIGRQMVYPILAACAVGHAEGLDTDQVVRSLEGVEPTANRLQPIHHEPSGAWILLDAYKSAEETIWTALDAMASLTAKRKIIVLGDVEEPRGSQGPIYKAIGLRVAEIADRALFIGGKTNFQRLKVGMTAGGLAREAMSNVRGNPLEAVGLLEPDLREGDLVLIKGRCTQHLERIALTLLGRQVGCTARFCSRRYDCPSCPRLRWGA